jgi:hypothetical protein
MRVENKLVHPCCPTTPVEVPIDCAGPGCVYLETKAAVVEVPASVGHELTTTREVVNLTEQPHDLPWGGAADEASPPDDYRYLKLHRLLL